MQFLYRSGFQEAKHLLQSLTVFDDGYGDNEEEDNRDGDAGGRTK